MSEFKKSIPIVIVLFSILALIPISLNAGDKDRISHVRHPKTAPPSAPSITPEMVSDWCRDHPSDCARADSNARRTSTNRELCMDDLGNNDGTISAWEYEQFNSSCP